MIIPVVSAILGGIVTLVITLITIHLQSSNANQAVQSSHQFQAWQDLQPQARQEATLTLEIYAYMQQCVAGIATWQECSNIDPYYNEWALVVQDTLTTGGDLKDLRARQLALTLVNVSEKVVKARTVKMASVSSGKVWPAYTQLDAWLANLIRAH